MPATLLGDYKPWAAWAFLQASHQASYREREWDDVTNSNSFVNISSLLTARPRQISYSLALCLQILAELSAKFSTKLRASRLKYLPNMPNILHFPLTSSKILNKRSMLATSHHLLSLSAHIYCALFWRHKCFAKPKKTKGHIFVSLAKKD